MPTIKQYETLKPPSDMKARNSEHRSSTARVPFYHLVTFTYFVLFYLLYFAMYFAVEVYCASLGSSRRNRR